ncbi:MAG: DNA-formamidopyrimidine glycosylase family protein [Acidobacteriota bacterium]|nr:DNA-formamidopyrimidine glycosylase family protein [Acidobacteriota bacterium]
MPALPDVDVYVECLRRDVVGAKLIGVRLASPFLLRSVTPPITSVAGRRVAGVRRLGKRIVFDLEDDLHLVIHLMIAGRFAWDKPGTRIPRKVGLVGFDFETGTLLLREAGSKKRASLHVATDEGMAEFDRGGLEVLDAPLGVFRDALTRENHTLKRSMTDPRILSGIGNAYSDEILHRAGLSPLKQTSRLSADEIETLWQATRATLEEWRDRLVAEAGDGWPRKVTAFRPEMAVHGRYGKDCPACGSPVQRIVYAQNECNYCAACQNQGRLLADRALSRLLKKDWPRNLEELGEMRRPLGERT